MLLFLAIFAIVNMACTNSDRDTKPTNRVEVDALHDFNVSLMNVIVRPETFDKRRLQVQGILSLGFEGNGLFFRREDYEYGLTANAVWLEVTPQQSDAYKKYEGQMVSLVGTFNKDDNGHMGAYAGSFQVESVAGFVPNAPSLPTKAPSSSSTTPPN